MQVYMQLVDYYAGDDATYHLLSVSVNVHVQCRYASSAATLDYRMMNPSVWQTPSSSTSASLRPVIYKVCLSIDSMDM